MVSIATFGKLALSFPEYRKKLLTKLDEMTAKDKQRTANIALPKLGQDIETSAAATSQLQFGA